MQKTPAPQPAIKSGSAHRPQATQRPTPAQQRTVADGLLTQGAKVHGNSHSAHPAHLNLLVLQKAVGNRAVGRLIQAKLTISHPNDPSEREADQVADAVMRMTEPGAPEDEDISMQPKPLVPRITPLMQREAEVKEEEVIEAQSVLQRALGGGAENEGEDVVATKPLVQRIPESELEEGEEGEAVEGNPSIQRIQEQALEEDEENVVTIKPLIQRQAKEEEEAVQAKELPVPLPRQVVNTFPTLTSSPGSRLQRVCSECEEKMHRRPEGKEELVQTQPLCRHSSAKEPVVQPKGRAQTSQVSPAVAANVHALEGGGSPLPQVTRSFFEPRFGADFSQVRVHTDSRAAETANSIHARAFTVGRNIAFGTGQYAPESREGRHLLGHELTHVVQQNGGQLQRTQLQAETKHGHHLPAHELVHTAQQVRSVAPATISRAELSTAGPVAEASSVELEEPAGTSDSAAIEATETPTHEPDTQANDVGGEADTEEIEIPTFDIGESEDCPQLISNEPLIPEESGGGEGEGGDSDEIYNDLLRLVPGGSLFGGFGLGGAVAGKLGLFAWRKLPISIRARVLNLALDTGILASKLLGKLLAKASFLIGPVLGWVQSGIQGFLTRLRSASDHLKVMLFEKFVGIIMGNSIEFILGYLKGLVQGFFVDGLLGIVQMIIDIFCLVKQFPKLIGALKKFFEVFPVEIARLATAIINLEVAIASAVRGAVDELWAMLKDPASIVGFLNTVAAAVEAASVAIGEKLADGLMSVASLPEKKLGKAAGRIGGMALFEIVLAVLTGGGGVGVTASKLAIRFVVKLMAKVGRHLLTVLRFIGTILRSFTPTLATVQRYLTPLFKSVVQHLARALSALDDFIQAILRRCRPGSVICKVPKKKKPKPPRPRSVLAKRIPRAGSQAFITWFDNLSPRTFMRYWNDMGSPGKIGAREIIEKSIRHPGGLHEWLKVSQTVRLKRWGVSMKTIKEARTPIGKVRGKGFRHGSKGSTTMHRELDELFEQSSSFADFKKRLNRWADKTLRNGRLDLPPVLRTR